MKYQTIDPEYIKEMKEYDEFMRQKKDFYTGLKCGYWLTITILLLSAFLNGSMVLAQSSNINFHFENAYAYSGLLPESTVLGNQRNRTELISSGNYSATYSFENDDHGSIPEGWTATIQDGTTIQIIDSMDGHNKVIEINDTSGNNAGIKNTFDDIEYGLIESWIRVSENAKKSYIYINDGGGSNIYIVMNDNQQWGHFTTGGWVFSQFTNDIGWVKNTWYHVKVEFNCSTDLFNIIVNGISLETNVEFRANAVNINNFNYGSDTSNQDYIIHGDAIGFLWDYDTIEYDVSNITLDAGTHQGGNIDNVNIDDGNYYRMIPNIYDEISGNIIFNESYPLANIYDNVFLSYHLETDGICTSISDGYGTIDLGGVIEESMISITSPLTELTFYADVSYPLEILWIYYIHLTIEIINYNIGDNLIAPFIETNVTETDKFEFTYDSSGNMNQIGNDDISGFTDIENDHWSNDVVNVYDSIDGDLDKSIRITSAQLGECGIERNFDTNYINTSQVHWQLELSRMSYPEAQIYTKIKNNDGDIVAWFKLEGATGYIPIHDELANLYYYYNSGWTLIKANIGVRNNYNMTFELNWINGSDYGVLGFDGTNYPILFENDQDSLGLFQIYAIADHSIVYGTLDFQIDWVRIIVNGTSLSDELMPENVFVLSGEPFSLLHQSFIEIVFDTTYENNVSIYLNDDVLLMDNSYNTSTETIFFRNLYQDKSYSGLYLKIYNSTDYNFESIKIYGIKLVSQQNPDNNAFLEFSYSEINPNISYFYVYQNDLYYNLETDDDTKLEYIQATFHINDLSCNGYTVAFSHQKGITDIESEARIGFTTETYLIFMSLDQITTESLILPQNKIINEITFLITDDDNNIIDTSKGYFTALTFIFYPDMETTITTLSLIEVLPIILLLTVIPIAIYYGFGKKEELVVPSIMFISIFGTATGIIPLWLEVIILFSCLMFYIVKKKVI